MHEKNNSNSNSLGVCQRLFNFFIENLVARGVKRVTLGQQESFGPAKPKGEVMLVHHQDHENSNDDLGLGSEIQVHFKQSEGLESWPIDKFADHSQMHMDNGIPDQVRPIIDKATEKGKTKVPNLTNTVQSRASKKIESEEDERKKDKEKRIPNGNLTLPIQREEVRTPRSFIGSPSINKRSETFIKNKKEEMGKSISMDTKT